jgi:rhodanese-related sulfurtransferase
MLKYVIAPLVALMLGGPVVAYDEGLAQTYQNLFAAFDEQQTAKALHFMTPDKVVEGLKTGEPIVLLDVRTAREQSIVGVTQPDAIHIPMNKVFTPEGLAQIPTDKKVVVTCHSGVRCTAVTMALRNIGFDNVYSMKGGLKKLIEYVSAKTAY